MQNALIIGLAHHFGHCSTVAHHALIGQAVHIQVSGITQPLDHCVPQTQILCYFILVFLIDISFFGLCSRLLRNNASQPFQRLLNSVHFSLDLVIQNIVILLLPKHQLLLRRVSCLRRFYWVFELRLVLWEKWSFHLLAGSWRHRFFLRDWVLRHHNCLLLLLGLRINGVWEINCAVIQIRYMSCLTSKSMSWVVLLLLLLQLLLLRWLNICVGQWL